MVPGDPAATAQAIAGAEFTYRVGILLGFVTHVIFLFLVVSLYGLFEGVDKGHAVAMVVLVSVGVAVALASMLARFAPLVLLGNADNLTAFTRPQLEALSQSVFRYRSSGAAVPMGFWGLWLFPFGILVIKSRFLPRVLGWLLSVAGAAYLVTSITNIILPEHRGLVSRIMTPLYFGEVPIIFWLLIRGASPQPGAPRAQVA